MENIAIKTKRVAIFGVAIALWVVLSTFLHVPIGIGHLWIDIGYIVYGVMLTLYGPVALIVGVLGVLIENLLFTGWISFSWMAGQLVIGICAGYVFKNGYSKTMAVIAAVMSTLMGIGLIKTLIEIALGYGVFEVKIVTNTLAAILDVIPLLVGYYIAQLQSIKRLKQ